MKHLMFVIISVVLLQACASHHAYQPAGRDGYGYRHTKLSDTSYRVDFKARAIEPGKAQDYALLRAAELTLEKGYDWFEIIHRDNHVSHKHVAPQAGFQMMQGRSIQRDCGLLGCKTRVSEPHNSLTIAAGVGEQDRGIVTVLLEINMGKGVRPDAQQVYSARELAENLRTAP